MQSGRGGMGSNKHGTCGHSTKSPKMRHALKREAEKDVRLGIVRIKNPKSSVREALEKR